MKRILFVDDEQNVLDGLRGLLRKQRKNWDMTFLTSGEAALNELMASDYDVIVSDMRMPGMDGATLLRRVMSDYPHIVRIVLSGQTEQEVSRRMVHVAHQFMAKPCDGQQLQQVIERACSLQALLELPELRHAVGQMGQLPVKPSVYGQLIQVLENPNSSMGDAAAVIERDIGTAAKMLQVVNSAFFGLPQRVADIKTAVSYLGLEMVKSLALSVEMRQSQANVGPVPGYSLDVVQEHGLLSGRIARRLLGDDRMHAQDAFSAAMLQDAGAMVLMTRMPQVFKEIVVDAHATGRSLDAVELERLGVTHAEIGAYLLGIWGLPYGIVEAVAHHHHPARSGAKSLDVVGAVHVASALVQELEPSRRPNHVDSGVVLDEVYLAELGVTDRLPAWREIAKSEHDRAQN